MTSMSPEPFFIQTKSFVYSIQCTKYTDVDSPDYFFSHFLFLFYFLLYFFFLFRNPYLGKTNQVDSQIHSPVWLDSFVVQIWSLHLNTIKHYCNLGTFFSHCPWYIFLNKCVIWQQVCLNHLIQNIPSIFKRNLFL